MYSGVDDGARTHDNRNHNPGLYQLSYVHHCLQCQIIPSTSRNLKLYEILNDVTSYLFLQKHIDTLEIVFIQCSGRLFQSQSVDDRVVAGLRQIATGHEYLLLCIQHIDIDTDTDFVSELVGLQ